MPGELIRMHMLMRMPVGTKMERVIKVVERNRKWKIDAINNDSGYRLRYGTPAFVTPYNIHLGGAIGTQSIRAYLGKYTLVFRVDVVVFFGFDENSRLVDLHVIKYVDAL